MENKSSRKLIIYQKAKSLVLLVYKITNNYPKSELFVIVPQIRRAVLSVAANIVEGYARNSTKEYVRYLTIAIGSLTELEVFIDISLELKYLSKKDYDNVMSLITENKKLLYVSRNTISRKVKR